MKYDPKRIYGKGRERVYSLQVKKLESAAIGEPNKALIKRFGSYLFTQGCGDLREKIIKIIINFKQVLALQQDRKPI